MTIELPDTHPSVPAPVPLALKFNEGLGLIRTLPAQAPRVETGLLEFGEDWRGLFIRGDSAFHYALNLRAVLALPSVADTAPLQRMVLEDLLEMLEGADERHMRPNV